LGYCIGAGASGISFSGVIGLGVDPPSPGTITAGGLTAEGCWLVMVELEYEP
jgi:hypothetical protein